jgi:hypothetical protein
MNGEQYLEFEDWQTVGQFYGYTVKTGDAVAVEIDGVKGAKAHADLIDYRSGLIVGGAEAYCMRDEEKWNTRPKYEWQEQPDGDNKRVKIADEAVPWFQLASMAQTRAGAKAFSNRLRWVVVLAGYRGTPAEEMNEDAASEAVKERRTIDKSTHFCTIHNVNWFKKGRMKGFAHPIEGTNEWCNEPDPVTVGSATSTPEVKGDTISFTETILPNGINLDHLKGALNLLQWTDVGKHLTTRYGVKGAKVSEMVELLSREQSEEFVKEVERRLDGVRK